MHLKIKPDSQHVSSFYENHSTYHEGDSGLDLFVTEEIIVPPKAISFQINLKVSCEALKEKNHETNVSYYLLPRSSMGAKTPLRLSNSVGLMDAGYRGNVIAIVDNISDESFRITEGNRLFQLCSRDESNISFEVTNILSETTRGSGGLGSTGN